MKRRISEWFSILVAKNPGRLVLAGIFAFNIVFLIVASVVISSLSLTGTESMNFFEAAFCTVTMILDAGCISYVVADIGQSGVLITVICLLIVLVGMITFTGAVIGYITTCISDFITNANAGHHRVRLSDHVIILNWNNRASEIINDLMYCDTKQKVVVLVRSQKEEIEREINERLTDTVHRENEEARTQGRKRFAGHYSQRVTVVIREGDVFSSKQLRDISLDRAKTVIILGDERTHEMSGYRNSAKSDEYGRGNSQTIKTLMQVADMTSQESSSDDQKVVVEISDEWTWELVQKVIDYKQVDGKCNIVPVRVNKVLGQLLSQFSIMPELNIVYRELLSNKGMSFGYEEMSEDARIDMCDHIASHTHAIPLSESILDGTRYLFYAAEHDSDISRLSLQAHPGLKVNYDTKYAIDRKHVIILGHNSMIADIMNGFDAFRTEWKLAEGDEILDIMVIDDKASLEQMNFYKDYSFVRETVAAGIYDKDLICDTIREYVSRYREDTSILILSDDSVHPDEIDSQALANLVYVQDIIREKKATDRDFDEKSIDVIVEIIDPKHHDIVSNYSVHNVVISNRYISKMITQIGEKDALFSFYKDILTYDTDTSNGYESMEVYIKHADRLFGTLPPRCSAHELIHAIYAASVSEDLPEEDRNPSIALGYINKRGHMRLFKGDLNAISVQLAPEDLLIVYSSH